MSRKREDRNRIDTLLAELESRPGWRVKRISQSGKHHTAYPPHAQKIIMIPGTPGDWRWRKNVRSELRRAGWDGTTLD